MGCGASKDPKIAVADSIKTNQNTNKNNNNNNRGNQNQNRNGFKKVELKNDSQYNQQNNQEKKAPLAFVISFDENKTGNPTRPPPGRLRLEPLKHATSRADIDDKIRSAEIKREKILADRAKSSSNKKNNQSLRQSHNDRLESDSFNRNDFDLKNNYQRKESEENKQRLLNRRRIIRDQDDDDIEHDRYYNRDNDQF